MFALLVGVVSCKQGKHEFSRVSFAESHTEVPQIEVSSDQLILNPNEGLVYYQGKVFSGYGVERYQGTILLEKTSYNKGKKHGLQKKWYPNGTLSMSSNYKRGKLHGISQTWWKDGTLRSESSFEEGVVHGIQRQWYKSGALFKELNLANGQEEGLQRAWRENGKIYNNYEARNGRIFGLKRSKLCYELKEEDII